MNSWMSSRAAWRTVGLLVVLAVGMQLPFVHRAYFIDDCYHSIVARQILRDPVDPYGFTAGELSGSMEGWTRGEAPWLVNPPGMHYLLACAMYLAGPENVTGHRVLFLVFPALSVALMYLFACRHVAHPAAATVLVSLTPAFLVTSIGLMIDSPLLTFALATVVALDEAIERRSVLWGIVSAVCLGCCVLIKYTGGAMAAVVAAMLWVRRDRIRSWMPWAGYAAVPAVMFGAWTMWNVVSHGESHFLRSLQSISIETPVAKLFSQLCFFSGCLVFPAVLLAVVWVIRRRRVPLYTALGLWVTTAGVLTSPAGGFSLLQGVMLGFLLATSVVGIVYVGTVLLRRNDQTVTVCLVWWVTVFVLMYRSIGWAAARYYLLLLPPTAVLVVTAVERLIGEERVRRALMGAAATLTGTVAVMAGIADYLQAEVNRRIAADVRAFRPSACGRAFFIGNSFLGYTAYLERDGWRMYCGFEPLRAGDRVLVCRMLSQPVTNRLMPLVGDLPAAAVPVRTFRYESGFPVRVMSKRATAGFYGSFIGSLPIACSRDTLEVFDLFHVVRDTDGSPGSGAATPVPGGRTVLR